MRGHSGGRLGLGLTAVVFLLILLPSLTGRALLAYRDMLQNHWPMKAAYWTRPGDLLPKWNPDLFGGMSYLADLIQQPFYPFPCAQLAPAMVLIQFVGPSHLKGMTPSSCKLLQLFIKRHRRFLRVKVRVYFDDY